MSNSNKKSIKDKFAPNFRRGTELLQRGEIEKAIQLLERAHKLEPEHVDTAVNLSGAYILRQKFKEAVAILEPLSESNPDHVMVWINLGAARLGNPILAKDEDQLKAIAAFTCAIELNPIAPNAAYNIGLIYRDRKDNKKAIQWFKKAIQANPTDQDARNIIKKLEAKE